MAAVPDASDVSGHSDTKHAGHGATVVEITCAASADGAASTAATHAAATVPFFAADIVDLKGANRAHKALWSALPLPREV